MNTNRLGMAVLAVIGVLAAGAANAWADAAKPHGALAKMPVKEVTAFKDGHAYVVHQGKMPTDKAGNVVMDYLPAPVLGTFWPYSAGKGAKLSAVTAGQQKVLIERTALNLRDLIESNPGVSVLVTELPPPGREAPPAPYEATILPPPVQSGEELEATSPPNQGEKLPLRGELALFKTQAGVKAVPFGRIQDITFREGYKPKHTQGSSATC